MATATKTFVFASDAEGFTDVGDSANLTPAWIAGDGNPAGSLQFADTGGTENVSERARRSAASWETIFGIATGQTITDIHVLGWDELSWSFVNLTSRRVRIRCLDSTGASSVHSAGELFDVTGTPTSTGGTPVAMGAGTSRAVDAPYQPSATQVCLEIAMDLVWDGSGSLDFDYDIDNLAIQITYTAGASGATGSSTLTEVVGITSSGIPTRKGASVVSEVFGATSSGHSVQAALVFADSVDGSWTDQGGGTNLTAAIDETTANTSDYIRSELTPQDSGCRVKLATIGVPSSTSNHFVRWSIAKDVASGDTINMTVKLYQGGGNSQGAGTLIASFSRNNVSETFTTYSETLSSGQVASISNYADLYLEFFADTA